MRVCSHAWEVHSAKCAQWKCACDTECVYTMRRFNSWLCNTSWILTTRRYSQTSCWSINCVAPDLRVGESLFYWQEDQSKIQHGRTSGKWLEVEVITVKGPMVVISIGTSIFQVNAKAGYGDRWTQWICKNLQIRASEQEHLVLWPSCEGQTGNCSLKISYLTAILGRHGLMYAAPADLKKKKAECFSPQLLQGFWSMLKTKDVVMVQLSSLNTLTKKKSYGNIIVCSWPWQSIRSSAVSIFFFWDPNHERFGGWRRYNTFRKSSIASGTLLRGKNPSGCFIIFAISYNHLSFVPASRERVVPTNWQVRAISWRPYVQGKSDFNSSATVSAICADQGLPGSWKFEHTKGSNIGHELDQGPTWRLKLQILVLITITGPAIRSYPKNTTANVQHALEKCESLGSRKLLSLHGNPSAIARDFSPHISVFRRHFCRICSLSAVWYYRALSEANLTSLLPAVCPLRGYFSGQPVQDQLAWGSVL